MKPRQFTYLRPATIEAALDYLNSYGDDGRIVAGGQSLMPMMNFRLLEAQALIDIRHIEALKHIRALESYVEIGAAVTQNQLLQWPYLKEKLPLLAQALPWVGHFQTRNRGTVCGSIAHSDPSSELPLSLAILGGEVVLQSVRGQRILKAHEFQLGMLTTARESDELVTHVRFPLHSHAKVDFYEVARRHGDFAIMAVGALQSDDGQLTLGIAGGIGAPKVAHLRSTELAAEIDDIIAGLEVHDDVHASAEMRCDIARGLITKIVKEIAS
jgi:2-furoyl-CoA dehydrogenase FAD binding subunit